MSGPYWDRITKALERIATALEESTFIKREYANKMKRKEEERVKELAKLEPEFTRASDLAENQEYYFGIELKPPVPLSDPTVEHFLIAKILKPKAVKGLKYKLQTSGGLLSAVLVPRAIPNEDFEEIQRCVRWASEKYSERENQ
jgi:hypothetical protein